MKKPVTAKEALIIILNGGVIYGEYDESYHYKDNRFLIKYSKCNYYVEPSTSINGFLCGVYHIKKNEND